MMATACSSYDGLLHTLVARNAMLSQLAARKLCDHALPLWTPVVKNGGNDAARACWCLALRINHFLAVSIMGRL